MFRIFNNTLFFLNEINIKKMLIKKNSWEIKITWNWRSTIELEYVFFKKRTLNFFLKNQTAIYGLKFEWFEDIGINNVFSCQKTCALLYFIQEENNNLNLDLTVHTPLYIIARKSCTSFRSWISNWIFAYSKK